MKILELNSRSRTIFQQVVEAYLESGDPVGSRTVSKLSRINLSPASIRNVMADLEEAGLLYAPHTSAGRMPTHLGLRLFVDGLLEFGDLSEAERLEIESRCNGSDKSVESMLTEATRLLSGLSHCASIIMVPKIDAALKHMEFVQLAPGRGLVVLVFEDGAVENRLVELPIGILPSTLVQAGNYMNARMQNRTLAESTDQVRMELQNHQADLDDLAAGLVEKGLASWAEICGGMDTLIVRGRANLLDDPSAIDSLERIRQLFDDLETKRGIVRLLESASEGEGVKIFIGAENKLFSLSGSSVIAAPYSNEAGQIIGALGVIGPTRLNYARIVPMVDYTARVISRLL